MHEYRSPALKRLNCLLSEMDAAYHEAAQRQGCLLYTSDAADE